MTEREVREIAETCADKLAEVPDGFEITSALLTRECGYDIDKMDISDLMMIHDALFKAAGERRIRLDMSAHEMRLEGLSYNLDFAVFHDK